MRKVAAALCLLLALGCSLYSLPAAALASGSCAAPGFNRAPALSENLTNYKAVAFADFNGDGKTDMAAGTLGSGPAGTVKVYLGDGAGGFGSPASFQTGDSNIAWDVAAGDFNKDGKVDIVAANNFSNSVSLLLGNGGGGFGNGIMFDVGSSPRSIAVADFNRDGSPDLATANFFSNNVTVLLNDGAGGLGIGSARTTVNVAGSAQYVRTADFNNDNKPDLVVSSQNANGITVLLGDGAGNFTAAGPSFGPLNRATYGVAAGDFDGDGAIDLAVVGSDTSALSIWRGDGAGHFTLQGNVSAGLSPRFVVASDFDGDGRPDLLVTNADGNNVSLLRATGGGNFAPQRVFVAGTSQPLYAAAADLNGDNKTDAVVVNIVDLAIMLNDGAGGFLASEAFPLSNDYSGGAVAMAEGDFNSDGKTDVAVTRADRLVILQGVGGGKLQQTFSGPSSTPTQFGAVATGDFDRDGKLDVAATGGAGAGQLTVFHGDGAGGFPRTSVTRIDSPTSWLQVADFNNDGNADLVMPLTGSSPVSVFLNDGTGKFIRKVVP
ncbi:MAG TPA: VCBS repeat-containing protein, partial [Pyrinomonadaceae bacterium]